MGPDALGKGRVITGESHAVIDRKERKKKARRSTSGQPGERAVADRALESVGVDTGLLARRDGHLVGGRRESARPRDRRRRERARLGRGRHRARLVVERDDLVRELGVARDERLDGGAQRSEDELGFEGEAFLDFHHRLKALQAQGVLLAICSKNNPADVAEVFATRPEIPLHTNGSENAVRSFVTKRRISGETRSAAGKQARDTFLSLLKTCSKLAVSFWDYLGARLKIPDADRVPWLPDLIRQNVPA